MTQINKFAPVLIHTLNRYSHFKRCIESLSNCTYADKTDLYIAVDFPAKESHWDGYNKIIDYLPGIKGFNEVFVFKREENFGAIKNAITLRQLVFDKYDRVFVTEDDNEFSSNTLEYINIGLEKFKDDDSIYAICCSHHQIDIPQNVKGTYFKYKSYSPMGYGVWRDKFLYTSNNENNFKLISSILLDYNNFLKIKKERLDIISSLLESISKKYVLADGLVTAHLLINQMQCIFPMKFKVRNHGHDGSGINCGNFKNEENPFKNRVIDSDKSFKYIEEKNDEIINEIDDNLISNFKMPLSKRLFVYFRYYMFYLFKLNFSSKRFKKAYNKFK